MPPTATATKPTAKRRTASKPRRPAPVRTSAPAPFESPSHEQIAARAYQIWLKKGQPAGQDGENWAQAERELGAAA